MNLRRALAAVTFIALLPALYAATLPPSGAILSPTAGVVAVNGQPITSGTFVTNGDWISTGPIASASLTLPGASLLAAARTKFRLETSESTARILLSSGLLDVSGRLPVAVASAVVVPSLSGAEFRIEAVLGVAYLDVLSGSVAIKSPKASYTVPAGKSVALGNAQPLSAIRGAQQ
ncbi:MAG: hypothetical protein ACRD1Y_05140, partial [Terriglobales bacterium]